MQKLFRGLQKSNCASIFGVKMQTCVFIAVLTFFFVAPAVGFAIEIEIPEESIFLGEGRTQYYHPSGGNSWYDLAHANSFYYRVLVDADGKEVMFIDSAYFADVFNKTDRIQDDLIDDYYHEGDGRILIKRTIAYPDGNAIDLCYDTYRNQVCSGYSYNQLYNNIKDFSVYEGYAFINGEEYPASPVLRTDHTETWESYRTAESRILTGTLPSTIIDIPNETGSYFLEIREATPDPKPAVYPTESEIKNYLPKTIKIYPLDLYQEIGIEYVIPYDDAAATKRGTLQLNKPTYFKPKVSPNVPYSLGFYSVARTPPKPANLYLIKNFNGNNYEDMSLNMPTGNNPYTIDFNFKIGKQHPYLDHAGGQAAIVSGGLPYENQAFYVSLSNNKIVLAHWNNDWHTAFVPEVGKRYRLTTTWDGTTEKLYVDGNLVDQRQPSKPFNHQFGFNGRQFRMGAAVHAPENSFNGMYYYFTGELTTPDAYNTALNEEQIKSISIDVTNSINTYNEYQSFYYNNRYQDIQMDFPQEGKPYRLEFSFNVKEYKTTEDRTQVFISGGAPYNDQFLFVGLRDRNVYIGHWPNDWTTNFVPELNKWYQFATTWNGTHESLYIDGELKDQRKTSGLNFKGKGFRVGAHAAAPGMTNQRYYYYLNGYVRDIKVYDKIDENGRGLVKINDAYPTFINNTAKAGNMKFITNDYYDKPTRVKATALQAGNPFTVDLWFNVQQFESYPGGWLDGSYQTDFNGFLFSTGIPDATVQHPTTFNIYVKNKKLEVAYYYYYGNNVGRWYILPTGIEVNQNEWKHLTATYNSTDLKLYINGAEKASWKVSLFIDGNPNREATVLGQGYNTCNSFIGGCSGWSWFALKGYVSKNINIDNYVWSAEDIYYKHHAAIGSDFINPVPVPFVPKERGWRDFVFEAKNLANYSEIDSYPFSIEFGRPLLSVAPTRNSRSPFEPAAGGEGGAAATSFPTIPLNGTTAVALLAGAGALGAAYYMMKQNPRPPKPVQVRWGTPILTAYGQQREDAKKAAYAWIEERKRIAEENYQAWWNTQERILREFRESGPSGPLLRMLTRDEIDAIVDARERSALLNSRTSDKEFSQLQKELKRIEGIEGHAARGSALASLTQKYSDILSSAQRKALMDASSKSWQMSNLRVSLDQLGKIDDNKLKMVQIDKITRQYGNLLGKDGVADLSKYRNELLTMRPIQPRISFWSNPLGWIGQKAGEVAGKTWDFIAKPREIEKGSLFYNIATALNGNAAGNFVLDMVGVRVDGDKVNTTFGDVALNMMSVLPPVGLLKVSTTAIKVGTRFTKAYPEMTKGMKFLAKSADKNSAFKAYTNFFNAPFKLFNKFSKKVFGGNATKYDWLSKAKVDLKGNPFKHNKYERDGIPDLGVDFTKSVFGLPLAVLGKNKLTRYLIEENAGIAIGRKRSTFSFLDNLVSFVREGVEGLIRDYVVPGVRAVKQIFDYMAKVVGDLVKSGIETAKNLIKDFFGAKKDENIDWKKLIPPLSIGGILAAAGLFGMGGISDDTTIDTIPEFTVSGIVTDHNSNPLGGLKVVAIENGAATKSTYTDTDGKYTLSVTGSAIEPQMIYSPDKSKEVIKIFNFISSEYEKNNVDAKSIVIQNKNVSNTTPTADFVFNQPSGGLIYRGLKVSYDHWDKKSEAEVVRGFVNSRLANTAFYCGFIDTILFPKDCKQKNDIHFSISYQTEDVAGHEYGHGVSDGWSLPRGHCDNGQANPIEEAWANFASATARSDSYFGRYSIDIKNAVPRQCWNGNGLPDNEWALAGVMWDLEQLSPGIVYKKLSNSANKDRIKTIDDLFTVLSSNEDSAGQIGKQELCSTFSNHGFMSVCS